MPQEQALADVDRAFGAEAARELKRSLKRHGSRYCDLTTGRLHRVGRFSWYEATGDGFRTRRWALTSDGVFSLRDEADGLAQMLALYAPLGERDPLVKMVEHFVADNEWVGGERMLRTKSAMAPRVRDGVLALDLVHGDDYEGRKRRVVVALATGAVTVDAPVAWQPIEPEFKSLDDDDDATEHILTHDPDRTHDDGSMTDDEDR
jgi:hypothetical protein